MTAERKNNNFWGILPLDILCERLQKTENQELFLYALMQTVRWTGVSYVARQAGLTRQGTYDALSRENANPSFNILSAISRVLGVEMNFTI